MSRVKLTIGIVLIFILGGLTGVLSVEFYHKYEHRGGPPPHPSLAARVDFIMERLVDDLDLTKEQVAEIRPMVERTEKETTRLRDTIEPEMRRIHDRGFSAIREKLESAQQRKLDEVLERMRKFHRKPPEGD